MLTTRFRVNDRIKGTVFGKFPGTIVAIIWPARSDCGRCVWIEVRHDNGDTAQYRDHELFPEFIWGETR